MEQTTPTFEESGSGFEQSSHREGKVARTLEKQTAKLPSDLFLWAALGAMVASATVQLLRPKRTGLWSRSTRQGPLSLFVGQWVPTLLILGLYNKIVKVAGSDRTSS